MYCIYCEAELKEKSRFCNKCGKKVDVKEMNEREGKQTAFEEKNVNKVQEVQSSKCGKGEKPPFKDSKITDEVETLENDANEIFMKFKLGNEELCYTKAHIQYRELHIVFSSKIDKAVKSFGKYYKNNVQNFDAIYEKAIPYFLSEAKTMVRCGTNVLWNYGINVTEEEFAESVYEGLAERMQEVLDVFEEILQKVVEKEENISLKRGMQRAGRGRWTGGGFGVKGAIKGAITAGVMNVGTDMLRSFGDKVVDSLDQRTITRMKEKVYGNPKTLEFFTDYLELCYGYICASVCSILVHMKKIADVRVNDDKEYEQAKYYREKASKYRALCDCLRVNPFHWKLYGQLYSLEYSTRRVLEEMARYFGGWDKIKNDMRDIDTYRYQQVKEMSESSISAIDKKIKAMQKLSSEICCGGADGYLNDLYSKRELKLEEEEKERERKRKEEEKKKELEKKEEIYISSIVQKNSIDTEKYATAISKLESIVGYKDSDLLLNRYKKIHDELVELDEKFGESKGDYIRARRKLKKVHGWMTGAFGSITGMLLLVFGGFTFLLELVDGVRSLKSIPTIYSKNIVSLKWSYLGTTILLLIPVVIDVIAIKYLIEYIVWIFT